MKKRYKVVLVVFLVLISIFILVPEKHYKKSKNEAIEYVSNEYELHPLLSKFVVNTKLGRKIAYIFTKKTITNSLNNKPNTK